MVAICPSNTGFYEINVLRSVCQIVNHSNPHRKYQKGFPPYQYNFFCCFFRTAPQNTKKRKWKPPKKDQKTKKIKTDANLEDLALQLLKQ